MSLVIDGDFAVVDNLETITYGQKTSETTYSNTTVTNVLRRVQRKTLENVGQTKAVIVFHIWADNITVTPAANDLITDANSINYVVKEVAIEALQTRFKCTCTKAV